MLHNSWPLISFSIFRGQSLAGSWELFVFFIRAKLAPVTGSGQADQVIKSSYLASSKMQTGSLGPFPAQNAEDSCEDNTGTNDLQSG